MTKKLLISEFRPRAILFDFDGVLVSSLSAHVAAWDAASQELFHKELSRKLKILIVGHSTMAIAKMICQNQGQAGWEEQLSQAKKQHLRNNPVAIAPTPGALELTQFLRDNNIPYGIASNAPREFVNHYNRQLDFQAKVALGYEDVARPKPAPDLYLKCARELGISHQDHHQCIVFEDSLHGIKAAVDAGMTAIGIREHKTHADFLASGARTSFENLAAALEDF